jgi:hypothetical protein
MDIDAAFLIDRVIMEEVFYVYKMYNIVKEFFSISIAPGQSRVG